MKHYTSLQNLHTATVSPHYKSQPTTSSLYQQILLEARDHQHFLNQYNNKNSLPQAIFTSCHHNELQIIIDTGASMSIAPEMLDFTIPPIPSTTKSLCSLATTKTTVSGEGKATCLIKDFNGVTWYLTTCAYYVPDATIRFSFRKYMLKRTLQTLLCSWILRELHSR